MIPLPPRIYIYGALALLVCGLCIALKVQGSRLETAKLKLSAANAANTTNLVTINAQANALDQWKKLGRTPEQMAVFIANATERERAYNAVFAENRMLKESDRALPECVELLKMRIDKLCPGRAFILRDLANKNDHGGSPDSRGPPLTTGTDERLRPALSISAR